MLSGFELYPRWVPLPGVALVLQYRKVYSVFKGWSFDPKVLDKTITEKSTKLILQLLVVVPNAQTEFQEIDPISATPNVLEHLEN